MARVMPLAHGERHRILIVEDSKTHRQNYRRALAGTYELHWAINGRDALALAVTKHPHLIILDVNIEPVPSEEEGKPGQNINGLDVCRRIKRGVFKETPIFILSAKKGFVDKVKGRFAHADEYLTKPVDVQTLLETIYKYLGPPPHQPEDD